MTSRETEANVERREGQQHGCLQLHLFGNPPACE